MAGKRPPVGRATKGKGKAALVPPAKGAPKGKPFARGMKGAPAAVDEEEAGPPPRPMRGRIAVAIPVLERDRGRMGPPPPGRTAPPRMMAPPRASEYEERPSSRAPVMQQRGAPAAMARLRRGKVAF